VEKVKRMGASMVKLLVYYHPDSVSAPEVEKFVKKVVADCEHYDLGIMLEPLSYSLDFDKKLSSAEKNYVVIETARRLVTTGVDVLKVEFPLEISEEHDENNWRLACAKISSTSSAPWILLSAAVNFDVYLRQVEIACRAGASGIAVGRAVWQEAVHLDGKARLEFLRTTSRERLAKLAALCSDFGRPVNDFFRSDVPFDWYKKY
jgi:tagatose-1,6-bisphosphate aldolase